MLKMPYEEIVYKIEAKTGLTHDEIGKRVDEKLKALYGLVSKEGAAHIVANELGVKLFEQASGKLEVRTLLAGMRHVELHGTVMRVYEARPFKTESREGTVGSFLLGDPTGNVRIVLWNDKASHLNDLKEGMSIIVKDGYVKERNGFKEVHLGDKSSIEVTGQGTVPAPREFKQIDYPRKTIAAVAETDNSVEVLGTIVQVFEPKYFQICSSCGKRAKQTETGFFCEQHGSITPSYTAVLNLFLDDGTETIRVVCFRKQLLRLISKNDSELEAMRTDPALFASVKDALLGSMLKVAGRVVKNPMFDRLELISSLIFLNPDPTPEIARVQEENARKSVPEDSGLDGVEQSGSDESVEEDIINDSETTDE